MSQPPEYLFGEIASEIDLAYAEEMVTNPAYREVVELAYAAGWKAREQQMIDQLNDTMKRMVKQLTGAPPEVYP